MKEPTTVKQAKQLTLDKIKRCMELPIKEREAFWYKIRWPLVFGNGKSCAFCHIAKDPWYEISECECLVKRLCNWFVKNVQDNKFRKKDLRKLYKMVEEVEG